jgi:hypothetical protein
MAARALKIDAGQINRLGKLAAEIANQGIEGMTDNAKATLSQVVGDGELSLIVQLHPTFYVSLAFNPTNPDLAAFEIARWQGDPPEAVRQFLN